jgi:hypothetical protein
MTKFDAHSSSFWAATQTDKKEAAGLGILERQRVRYWLKNAYGEIDGVQA